MSPTPPALPQQLDLEVEKAWDFASSTHTFRLFNIDASSGALPAHHLFLMKEGGGKMDNLFSKKSPSRRLTISNSALVAVASTIKLKLLLAWIMVIGMMMVMPMGSDACMATETPAGTTISTTSTTAAAGTTSTTPTTTTTSTTTSTSTTTTTTTTTTTAPICSCPSHTTGFIIDSDSVTQGAVNTGDQLTPSGTCTCSNSQTEQCFASVSDPNPGNGNDLTAADVTCPTPANFCVCAEDGECFTPISADSLSEIQFYPFCDSFGCHIYTLPLCLNGGFDQSDGLKSTTTSTIFTCSEVFQGENGASLPIGTNSPYIKGSSVSCRGCTFISQTPLSSCTGFPTG